MTNAREIELEIFATRAMLDSGFGTDGITGEPIELDADAIRFYENWIDELLGMLAEEAGA